MTSISGASLWQTSRRGYFCRPRHSSTSLPARSGFCLKQPPIPVERDAMLLTIPLPAWHLCEMTQWRGIPHHGGGAGAMGMGMTSPPSAVVQQAPPIEL